MGPAIDTPATFDGPRRGGIGVFDPLVIRQPIEDGRTRAVRDCLADWTAAADGGDVRTLLPVPGTALATLFLDRGAFGGAKASGDALVWYLEVADADVEAWGDPDRTIREASPLFDAGLAEHLLETGTVHAAGRRGHRLVTHATHPRRQERYAEHCGRTLVAPVAGDGLPIAVALLTVPLKRGVVSRIVGAAVDAATWIKRSDRVSEWLRDRTDTLEQEAMYTESLLLAPGDDRLLLPYYMETEDVDRLFEAYERTSNADAVLADWVMRRVFEAPEKMLEPPIESDLEVLVHAVHASRP